MTTLKVALTGGVASGKSTVARQFAKLGVPVIDADLIAREVVEPGSEGLAALVEAFGQDVLNAEGSLDRTALRKRVFSDPLQRKKLEGILHPRIRDRMREQADAAKAPYVILDIPLLAEGSGYEWLDRVLVVDLPEALQIERLIKRDGIDAVLAQQMLDAQASREQRLALADDVIDNRGSLADLEQAVAVLHEKYLLLAKRR